MDSEGWSGASQGERVPLSKGRLVKTPSLQNANFRLPKHICYVPLLISIGISPLHLLFQGGLSKWKKGIVNLPPTRTHDHGGAWRTCKNIPQQTQGRTLNVPCPLGEASVLFCLFLGTPSKIRHIRMALCHLVSLQNHQNRGILKTAHPD